MSGVRTGHRLPPLTKGPVTRQMLVEWCAAENDYYHLHFDERVAEAMGMPGTPIQAMIENRRTEVNRRAQALAF